MNNIYEPLTEQEMDQLEAFLLDRIDEDEVTEDSDEGILDISTLDGFMTALVSGPSIIAPSKWMPAVWGDFEPDWESPEQLEEILTLMMRHMNGIVTTLMESPNEFEPIFKEHEANDRVYRIVDEWCDGYLRGMSLDSEGWSETEAIEPLLGAMLLFASEEGWEKLDKMTIEEVERHQDVIAPAARRAHAYWFERRENGTPIRRDVPKVGRNDPCPCGSGKKYKKCCGSGPTLY